MFFVPSRSPKIENKYHGEVFRPACNNPDGFVAFCSGSASERWRQPLTTMLWAAMPIGGITRMASAARRDQLS